MLAGKIAGKLFFRESRIVDILIGSAGTSGNVSGVAFDAGGAAPDESLEIPIEDTVSTEEPIEGFDVTDRTQRALKYETVKTGEDTDNGSTVSLNEFIHGCSFPRAED